MATAKQTLERLNKLKRYMLEHTEGLKLGAIVAYMGEDRQVVRNDLEAIGATSPSKGIYIYTPTADEVKHAQAILAAAWQEKKEN